VRKDNAFVLQFGAPLARALRLAGKAQEATDQERRACEQEAREVEIVVRRVSEPSRP
jgi:hypothetical protein